MTTCAHCGTQFAPARPLQAVCSPVCATRMVRVRRKEKTAQKAQDRKQTRERKEAAKTIPTLIKEAQKAFNAWIRERDARKPCISCGCPPPDMSGFHAGRDAGHWRSTGAAKHLRFHEDNCHAQCVSCNQFGAGMAVEYRIGLIARIGIDRVEALENNNEVHKWTKEELRDIKKRYAEKLKELKRNHE